jgi:hypothetical protein
VGVALASIAVSLTACSPPAPAGSSPTTTVSATATPSPTMTGVRNSVFDPKNLGIRISLPVSRTLKVSDAVPARFTGSPTETVLTPGTDPGLSFNGLSEDGSVLALSVSRAPADADHQVITGTTSIGYWKASRFVPVATSGRESRGPLQGRLRQVGQVVQAGHRLLWTESPSTDLAFNEWSLRSVDTTTGKIHEIAHSAYLKPGGRIPDVVGGTYPVVIGDWVYWATAVPRSADAQPDKRGDWSFDIQRTRLDGRAPVETVARNAVMPAALDGALVYASYRLSAPNVYEIHRQDVVDTAQDRVLVKGYRSGTSWLSNLAASGSLVVWTAQSTSLGAKEDDKGANGPTPGELFVLDTSSGQVTRVITQDSAAINGSISFTRRGVVWGNGSGSGDPGEYVLDLVAGRIQKLGECEGLSRVMGRPDSDTVYWVRDPGDSPKIYWQKGTLS